MRCTGVLISWAIHFNRSMLRPSRSRLFFGSKALMVSTTLMGPVLLIFSLEVLGLTGMESSAFFSVGMTESDICLPISAKNLLKCSAISSLFSII